MQNSIFLKGNKETDLTTGSFRHGVMTVRKNGKYVIIKGNYCMTAAVALYQKTGNRKPYEELIGHALERREQSGPIQNFPLK